MGPSCYLVSTPRGPIVLVSAASNNSSSFSERKISHVYTIQLSTMCLEIVGIRTSKGS